MNRIALLLLFLVCSLPALGGNPIPIGGTAPDLLFKDRSFLSRSLSELKYRAVIVFVMDPTCPLVKRLVPIFNDLQKRIWERKENVLILGTFVDPNETVQTIQDYALRNKVAFPVVKWLGSRNKSLAETLSDVGLNRLSSVLLLGEKHEILYRGRVTDEVRFTGIVPGGRNHLREALDAYLAGRPISPTEVEAEGCTIEVDANEAPAEPVTWNDVAPIFGKHCVSCHRQGGGAPFALDTHAAATRKARTILRVIHDDQMPPWYASPDTPVPFMNENRLDRSEKKLLTDWIRSRSPGPDLPKLVPTVPDFPKPDKVYLTKVIHVPASGKIPYVNLPILSSFSLKERWISAIRIVPTNPRVVHHANLAYVRAADVVKGVSNKNFIVGYVPGVSPMVLEPGMGLKIPGLTVFGLQVHVVTTGVEETTQLRIEVKYADRVDRRLRFHLFDSADLSIPPEHPYHPVSAEWTTPRDIELVGAFAHMHYRGKDFRMSYQDGGKSTTLLGIPNWQFDWQMGYQWPQSKISVARGSRFDVLAHFDNSRFNVYNPDPLKRVTYGEQSDDEMMIGFVYYLLKDEDLDLEI